MSRLYELKRKLLLHNRVALEHQAKEHAGELARKQDFCEAMRMEAVREKVKCEGHQAVHQQPGRVRDGGPLTSPLRLPIMPKS